MFHTYTTQNIRPYQEDVPITILKYTNHIDQTATITENFARHSVDIIGVMDGHGGKEISNYVAEKLPGYIYKSSLLDENVPKPTQKYNDYIINIFNKIQNELQVKHNKSTDQGTTVCICLIYEFKCKKYISCIWTGDSRAIVCDQNLMERPLSLDHKPDCPKEYYRILKAGGTVIIDGVPRVNGVLAVSRSIGDFDNKIGIDHTPDILHIQCDHKFIVVATDGLWDVMTNQQVIDFVLKYLFKLFLDNKILENKTKKDKLNIACLLAEEAIRLGSEDNITITIYFLESNSDKYLPYIV